MAMTDDEYKRLIDLQMTISGWIHTCSNLIHNAHVETGFDETAYKNYEVYDNTPIELIEEQLTAMEKLNEVLVKRFGVCTLDRIYKRMYDRLNDYAMGKSRNSKTKNAKHMYDCLTGRVCDVKGNDVKQGD